MAILTRGLLNSTALTNVGLVTGLALASGSAMALPQNGQVVGGSASIVQSSPSQLTINQSSSNAVINWQSFSIGKNEGTTFNQPNSGSIAFNRVTGTDASNIQGSLKANGTVVLVNPNGTLFTNTARVDAGGLIVSTAGFTNANAMAGKMVFDQAGQANAKITNAGTITAEQGGLVALVAPNVANSGVINAKLGKVALASGDKWAVDLYGDKLVQFAVDDTVSGKIDQSGIITANTAATGGYAVQMTVNDAKGVVGNAINMGGVINATSVSTSGGDILLEGGNAGTNVTGQINSNGGKVVVSGADVTLAGANINATGTAGGGLVDIGTGDGVLANNVTVGAKASITSNGGVNGNGGDVTVKSSGSTVYAGSITSQGGTSSGHGGNVTTDGNTLNVDGATVDTSAPAGNAGDWNLVATNVNVTAGMAKSIDSALAKGNVDVASGEGQSNDITVSSNINWNSGNTLTLESYQDIGVNAKIKNAGTGNIVLRADDEGTDVGSVTFGTAGSAITNGQVGIYYDPIHGYTQPVTYTAAQAHGAQGTTAYMLVNNFADLTNVNENLGGTYALGKTINFVTADGQSTPIGNPNQAFTGLFDGFGGIATYTINNLWFHGSSEYGVVDIGVFGNNAGTIRNVTANDVNFAGLDNTGGLVGYNSGILLNDHANGLVHGYDVLGTTSNSTGGLVGFNAPTGYIKNGSAAGTVSIEANSDFAGGFVGTNEGTILDSAFTGTVDAGCNEVGGFVGGNYGLISGSTAAAKVINGGGGQIGGFAGLNGSTTIGGIGIISEAKGLTNLAILGTTLTGRLLNNSAKAGSVYSADNNVQVGGFVGVNENGAVISGGTATGNVYVGDNTTEAGGFAGANLNGATIKDSSTNTTMTIGSNDTDVGGFVGLNSGVITGDTVGVNDPSFGSNDTNIGGFAGYNSGTINGAISSAAVTGQNNDTNIGGLVGYNIGTVTNSMSTGNVTLADYAVNVGGLIGYNSGVLSGNTIGGDNGAGVGGPVPAACDCTDLGPLPPQSPSSAVNVGNYATNIGGYVGQDAAGSIAGVSVSNSVRTGNYAQNVGGLVGFSNKADLANDTVKANVYTGEYSRSVGGFVGLNSGTIESAGITGLVRVSGDTEYAGGVIGANYGTVIDSHFDSGSMVAGCDEIGGFVGGNFGTVSNSSFSGVVINNGGYQTGGFAGQNNGLLASDVVTNGDVDLCGVTQAGGFVGYNSGTGTITNGFATVTLTDTPGVTDQGGFAGKNDGVISNSFTDANVTIGSASNYIGGFVGVNSGFLTNDSAAGTVNASNNSMGVGGFAGRNDRSITNSTTTAEVNTTDFETNVGGYAGVNNGTITGGIDTNNVTVGKSAQSVGGFAGRNTGLISEAANQGFTGTVTVGSGATAVGGLVGYNIGRVNGGTVHSPVTVGDNAFYVGGDIGWNDAGGTVSGVFYDGQVLAGNNATAVGGVVGLNGSDPSNGRGDFGTVAAAILSGSAEGGVTVGTNSFAIGGLVGWNSAWTANNSMSGTVYFGEVSDGYDPVLAGNNVTSQGVVYGGDGTTYIHNANQIGCDERAGGNCFGVAGQEALTINAEPDANTAGDTLYYLTGFAPGNPNELTGANVLESHDVQAQVINGDFTLMPDPNNPGFFIVSVGPSFGLNPANRNANLDYTVKFAYTPSVPPTVKPVTPVTPTTTGNPNPLPQVITPVTPFVAASQGNLEPLIPTSLTGVLNQANQTDCIKVNLEVRGVQSDSPIDCSQPLQVNGF